MAERVAVSMRGLIDRALEGGGWIAHMTHPQPLVGKQLTGNIGEESPDADELVSGVEEEATESAGQAKQGLIDVELTTDTARITRSYPNNPRSRVRVTDLPHPDISVRPGSQIVALVSTIEGETGEFVQIPGERFYDPPRTVPETATIGATVLRWGLATT